MPLEHQVLTLAETLTSNDLRLATAESCTGGWLSQLFTSVPGSSYWFEGAIVSYSNAVKTHLLNVPENHLLHYGSVSQPVVERMATGAQDRFQVPVSIAVSGIAGPGGGRREKPVGMVWIAWCLDVNVRTQCFFFEGDRQRVRWQAVEKSVTGLNFFLSDIL